MTERMHNSEWDTLKLHWSLHIILPSHFQVTPTHPLAFTVSFKTHCSPVFIKFGGHVTVSWSSWHSVRALWAQRILLSGMLVSKADADKSHLLLLTHWVYIKSSAWIPDRHYSEETCYIKIVMIYSFLLPSQMMGKPRNRWVRARTWLTPHTTSSGSCLSQWYLNPLREFFKVFSFA